MQDKQSHVEQGLGRFTATPSLSEPQVVFVAKERHIGRFQGKPGSEVYLEDWIRDINLTFIRDINLTFIRAINLLITLFVLSQNI